MKPYCGLNSFLIEGKINTNIHITYNITYIYTHIYIHILFRFYLWG